MTNNKTTKQTYIKSVEASRLYESIHRKTDLNIDFTGMIPYSLELIKLREIGLDEYKIGKWNKELEAYETMPVSEMDARQIKAVSKFHTDDIINVSFDTKVKTDVDTIKAIESKYELRAESMKEKGATPEELENALQRKMERIKSIQNSNIKDWKIERKAKDLREMLYESGFELVNYQGKVIKYVPYKRSSAKARTGNVLFINAEIASEMIEWSRMGINVPLNEKLDTASLMAYESLVSSSIKKTIKINPKNILIVDDVESTFKLRVKEITDLDGQLISLENPEGEINNSLFDGQGLLDASYFKNNEGMMLLRQHFFKSCVFNTNVIEFMKDRFSSEYDTATINDMFGNKIKVKDIHMITTPSSLKVFKFSSLVGDDKEMYKHWKKVVNADGKLFGVCKSESKSKFGNTVQQMSYQMINSLPTDKAGIQKLAQREIDYVNSIKRDNDAYAQFLIATADRTNNNEMFYDLLLKNTAIKNTEVYHSFRKTTIDSYIKRMRTGKIRISGDYAVMVGNPFEMLLHSIGKLDTKNLTSQSIKGSELHTKMFKDGTELVGFRNPHTSANNIYACVNKLDSNIDKYFNFTRNIVAVNAIENPILDFLSGADFDSDTVLLTDDETLVEISKKNEAIVCINKISSKKNLYTLNASDRATVDNNIHSDLIGKVVNTGQLAQSVMYDAMYKGEEDRATKARELLEIINVFSTIAIDLAKKSFDIDINEEYKRLAKEVRDLMLVEGEVVLFPNFRKSKDKPNTTHYHTPMDYLQQVMKDGIQSIEQLREENKIKFFDLVKSCNENGEKFEIAKANDKQEKEIVEMVQDYNARINKLNMLKEMSISKNNDSMKDFYTTEILALNDSFNNRMSKKTIKPETMYSILYHMFYSETIAQVTAVKLLGALYASSPKNFINAFC